MVDGLSTGASVGRRSHAGVAAWQEPLGGEIPVRVEVPLVDFLGCGKETNLALCLGAQSQRMFALSVRPGMVADDGVVECALADGGSVESAPPLARGVEGALDRT